MSRILGIGGIFFKSEDPEKLKNWYIENLGLEATNDGYVILKWMDAKEAGHAGIYYMVTFQERY